MLEFSTGILAAFSPGSACAATVADAMTICTVSGPWWSTIPLNSAAIQMCPLISLSLRNPLFCTRVRRCVRVANARSPSSGSRSARQCLALAHSLFAIAGVSAANGGNANGSVAGVIARPHTRGARSWPRWRGQQEIAERYDAVAVEPVFRYLEVDRRQADHPRSEPRPSRRGFVFQGASNFTSPETNSPSTLAAAVA
jgi:hypothetical protein